MAILLVDMDGPLADFEAGHQRVCREQGYPDFVTGADRTSWDILTLLSPEWRRTVHRHWRAPGFFAELPPVEEALKTLREWDRQGHRVFLCTAPLSYSDTCAQEKLAWVGRHLGHDFVRRTIITSDKTLVTGDILLDDKPEVHGVGTPAWRHLVYHMRYNRELPTTYTWEQAREVVACLAT